jgi:hypothetical protein
VAFAVTELAEVVEATIKKVKRLPRILIVLFQISGKHEGG